MEQRGCPDFAPSLSLDGNKFMQNDLYQLMKQALVEAEKGYAEGEVPVGAVLATQEGELIAGAHNQPITLNDPSAHAEILVMRKAGLALENYRLTNTILVATIEPCLMCMGAALHARIAQVVFGAADPKAGAAGSVYNLAADENDHDSWIFFAQQLAQRKDPMALVFLGCKDEEHQI